MLISVLKYLSVGGLYLPLVYKNYIPLLLTFAFVLCVSATYQFMFLPDGEFIFKAFILPEFFIVGFISFFIERVFWGKFCMTDMHTKFFMLSFVMIYVVLCVFGAQKSLIPMISPYQWDPVLSQIDRFIHFGYYPHELLQVKSWPLGVITFIDRMYLLWFIVIYLSCFYFLCWERNYFCKKRFVISFVLTWIVLGNLVASLASSVGPVFWSDFYDVSNPYEDFVQHLNAISEQGGFYFSGARDFLINLAQDDAFLDINGISAMPSLHVGMAFLIFLSLKKELIFFKMLSFFFLLIVLIGSVALGWHYGIDGYCAMICVYLIWRFVGWALARWDIYVDDRFVSKELSE